MQKSDTNEKQVSKIAAFAVLLFFAPDWNGKKIFATGRPLIRMSYLNLTQAALMNRSRRPLEIPKASERNAIHTEEINSISVIQLSPVRSYDCSDINYPATWPPSVLSQFIRRSLWFTPLIGNRRLPICLVTFPTITRICRRRKSRSNICTNWPMAPTRHNRKTGANNREAFINLLSV